VISICVGGNVVEYEYLICQKCINDTTVAGVTFDENGVCNYCKLQDKMEKQYPLNERGEEELGKIIKRMKRKGKRNKYDCVIGISGGRDSTYTLFLAKELGLKPLAVHFNDHFGNPVAGENMRKTAKKLNVEIRTVTSDINESKDIRLSFLKASTPDLAQSTDLGIATALYSTAVKENIKYTIIGQSFRTEGIAPLEWHYLDGKYLKSVHRECGTTKLSKWSPENPGFNLNMFHLFYYTVVRQIKTVPLLYYVDYVRNDVDQLLEKELDWVNTGAHYYDDLYQALMTYVLRVKFNIDRRRFNYSALIRSGQMTRQEALDRLKEIYIIEDPEVIDQCIKWLGISHDEFEEYLSLPVKTFHDYPTSYNLIKSLRLPIKFLSTFGIVPSVTYDKYFNCG